MQAHADAARRAEERQDTQRAEAVRLGRDGERYRSAAANLAAVADGAGLDLPSAEPAAVPDAFEAVEPLLAEARARFTDARDRTTAAETAVRAQADAVRIERDREAEGTIAGRLRETIAVCTRLGDYGTEALLKKILLAAEDRAHPLDHFLRDDPLGLKLDG